MTAGAVFESSRSAAGLVNGRGADGSSPVFTAKAPGEDFRPHLERDGVLLLGTAPFSLTDEEHGLAEGVWGDGRSKNASYNPNTGRIDGVVSAGAAFERLRGLMARYALWSTDVLGQFFPQYHPRLQMGRTSLRRRSVEDKPLSQRKDDRCLHVDAFTSQPVAGRRILRVFSNIDSSGGSRDWAVGEGGFEAYARRFRGRARRLIPGEAALLRGLSLTKARRTDYDQIMLCMHDAAKSDVDYQRTAPRRMLSFPAGATWVAFTDQSPHGVLKGHCALEQTFYLPVDALHDPTSSPLRILERLWETPLV
jgi:hypothetical protein